jgi:hypothetical protein
LSLTADPAHRRERRQQLNKRQAKTIAVTAAARAISMITIYQHILPIIIVLLHCYIGESQLKMDRQGLIVIPGLSDASRQAVVSHNLETLAAKLTKDWDCVVYVTADRSDTSFWGHDADRLASFRSLGYLITPHPCICSFLLITYLRQTCTAPWTFLSTSCITHSLKYISSVCDIVDYPNHQIADCLYAAQPALFQRSYKYVYVISENLRLDDKADLDHMLKVMTYNNLTIASPLVRNSNKLASQRFRDIMQTPAVGDVDSEGRAVEGHITSFLAVHAWLMTMDAFKALWELCYPHLNPYGWGYDLWYDTYANSRVTGHKMGIITTATSESLDLPPPKVVKSKKEEGDAALAKWQQQLAQEEYYGKYYNVPLKQYRNNFRGENPATGVLRSPPSEP